MVLPIKKPNSPIARWQILLFSHAPPPEELAARKPIGRARLVVCIAAAATLVVSSSRCRSTEPERSDLDWSQARGSDRVSWMRSAIANDRVSSELAVARAHELECECSRRPTELPSSVLLASASKHNYTRTQERVLMLEGEVAKLRHAN